MMKRPIVVAILVTLMIPAVSSAIPIRPGPYMSGFVGVTIPQNTDVTFNQFGPPAIFTDRVEFDPGINIGGAGGYDFGIVRLEGELSYKYGDISTVSSTNQNSGTNTKYTNADGSLEAVAMMFNGFFDLHNNTPVTPYFGGGVGFAVLHLSDSFGTIASGANAGTRQQLYFSDDDTVFAYQVGAGLEIALNRRLSLDLSYRYFGTSQADFNRNVNSETSLKFESHNVAVGCRVKF